MTEPSDNSIALTKNCIVLEDSKCEICELEGELVCKVDKKEANKFLIGNIMYRVTAITIFVLSGLLIGHWWMLGTYTGIVLFTFLLLEPWLLCSHCPFYEKEGRVLKCWALRGMPKIRKYQPGPMKTYEKILMLIFGTYIDLFPFLGMIWGIVKFAKEPATNLYLGIGIVSVSVVFLVLVYCFGQILLGNKCKKCTNFSCPMNKVQEEKINQFLDKNSKMKEAWLKAGWKENQK